MNEKFDPAPHHEYADNQVDVTKADKAVKTNLAEGLDGTFPASDPFTATRLAKSSRMQSMEVATLNNEIEDKTDIAQVNNADRTRGCMSFLDSA